MIWKKRKERRRFSGGEREGEQEKEGEKAQERERKKKGKKEATTTATTTNDRPTDSLDRRAKGKRRGKKSSCSSRVVLSFFGDDQNRQMSTRDLPRGKKRLDSTSRKKCREQTKKKRRSQPSSSSSKQEAAAADRDKEDETKKGKLTCASCGTSSGQRPWRGACAGSHARYLYFLLEEKKENGRKSEVSFISSS